MWISKNASKIIKRENDKKFENLSEKSWFIVCTNIIFFDVNTKKMRFSGQWCRSETSIYNYWVNQTGFFLRLHSVYLPLSYYIESSPNICIDFTIWIRSLWSVPIFHMQFSKNRTVETRNLYKYQNQTINEHNQKSITQTEAINS